MPPSHHSALPQMADAARVAAGAGLCAIAAITYYLRTARELAILQEQNAELIAEARLL